MVPRRALTSRIWRSSDPDLILSDGVAPPTGCCPAYVSAVVFIRNLKVTPRAAVAVDPRPPTSASPSGPIN